MKCKPFPLREKARMPRSPVLRSSATAEGGEERVPILKGGPSLTGGDEWPKRLLHLLTSIFLTMAQAFS